MRSHSLDLLLGALIDSQVLCKASETAIQISSQDFPGTGRANRLSRGCNNVTSKCAFILISI